MPGVDVCRRIGACLAEESLTICSTDNPCNR
jgi:hypothetical protein